MCVICLLECQGAGPDPHDAPAPGMGRAFLPFVGSEAAVSCSCCSALAIFSPIVAPCRHLAARPGRGPLWVYSRDATDSLCHWSSTQNLCGRRDGKYGGRAVPCTELRLPLVSTGVTAMILTQGCLL